MKAAVSRYQISKATGIPASNLSRVVHGRAGLSLDTVDKLSAYLGLRLVAQGHNRPRASKTR